MFSKCIYGKTISGRYWPLVANEKKLKDLVNNVLQTHRSLRINGKTLPALALHYTLALTVKWCSAESANVNKTL